MKEMIYKPKREIEILAEGYMDGFHYCIVSLGTHPCAYIELPKEHKYYGKHCDDIDILCHYGLTYSSEYGLLPKDNENHRGGFWIGWDYAHYEDYNGYEELFPLDLRAGGRKWSTDEILSEIADVSLQLLQTQVWEEI